MVATNRELERKVEWAAHKHPTLYSKYKVDVSRRGESVVVQLTWPGKSIMLPFTHHRDNRSGGERLADEVPLVEHSGLRRIICSSFEHSLATTVIVSLYCLAKTRTGHEKKACYRSVLASRDAFRSLRPDNLSDEEFVGAFDIREGYRIKGDKVSYHHYRTISEVQPFESTLLGGRKQGLLLTDALTPEQFEQLIGEVLRKRGYTVRETARSGDGGIDLVAICDEPIVGGTLIVQCKCFGPTNPVGEPVLRDLYGVVSAERANKGILVTTSDFTPAARRFAEGKQLELINGSMLRKLMDASLSSRERAKAR